MDTFSHAAWGYASLRWKSKNLAWWGLLAGAAPDLLWFIPAKIDAIVRLGWDQAWNVGHEPGIWRAGGPPMPTELVYEYNHYYIYTHSLVLLLGVLVLMYLIGKKNWLWLGIPYAFHLLLDFPTHERFQTQLFFPISHWSFQGISWSNPVIFYPNVLLLILTYVFIWWKYHHKRGNRPINHESSEIFVSRN